MPHYIVAVGGAEHAQARHRGYLGNRGYNEKRQSHDPAMVEFINKGNSVKVSDGMTRVDVGVVEAAPPYIRTYADRQWSDNLPARPRY